MDDQNPTTDEPPALCSVQAFDFAHCNTGSNWIVNYKEDRSLLDQGNRIGRGMAYEKKWRFPRPEGLMGIAQIQDSAQPVIKVTHPSIQTPALVKPGRGWISVLDIGNESSL